MWNCFYDDHINYVSIVFYVLWIYNENDIKYD